MAQTVYGVFIRERTTQDCGPTVALRNRRSRHSVLTERDDNHRVRHGMLERDGIGEALRALKTTALRDRLGISRRAPLIKVAAPLIKVENSFYRFNKTAVIRVVK
jgi:hypothetical protein